MPHLQPVPDASRAVFFIVFIEIPPCLHREMTGCRFARMRLVDVGAKVGITPPPP